MRVLRVLSAVGVLTAAACGGGGGGDSTGPPPPPPSSNQQRLGSIVPSVTALNVSAGDIRTISVAAYDTAGAIIQNAPGALIVSANTNVADVMGESDVIALTAGTTQLNISLTYNGVTKTATVPVTVTGVLPSSTTVVASSGDYTFTPKLVAVARNGSVTWSFGALEHTVTFSATSGAPSNIASGGYATQINRTFLTAGNFAYQCSIHYGMAGQVVVR